jgi:uncharacterized membrane protein
MQINPYAAPDLAPPGAPAPHQGEPQPWDVGDVVKIAWRLYAANWAPLTGAFFVITLIGMIPQQIPRVLAAAGVMDDQSTSFAIVALVCAFVAFVLGQFFSVGFTRAVLRVARTGQARFADVFSGASGFLSYFAATMLLGLAIGLGFVVFIVPGVILMLGTLLAHLYIVDQGMGPIDAIRASWAATDGHKGSLFVWWLASVGIAILGLLACCVGYFPAVSVVSLGVAIIYLRLAGLAHGTPSDAMASPHGQPPPPPPAAGGGPWGAYGPPGGAAPPAPPAPPGGGGPWGPYGPPGA